MSYQKWLNNKYLMWYYKSQGVYFYRRNILTVQTRITTFDTTFFTGIVCVLINFSIDTRTVPNIVRYELRF